MLIRVTPLRGRNTCGQGKKVSPENYLVGEPTGVSQSRLQTTVLALGGLALVVTNRLRLGVLKYPIRHRDTDTVCVY